MYNTYSVDKNNGINPLTGHGWTPDVRGNPDVRNVIDCGIPALDGDTSVMVMASGGGGLVQSPPDMLHHHNIMDTSSHVEMMPSEVFDFGSHHHPVVPHEATTTACLWCGPGSVRTYLLNCTSKTPT
ncbi:hypothetical protein KGM_206410 [Danaus plexippus plexippus]|uniref:Uncharacterized protein n=1 Tax=Danaus plexippus plexippus TaxID=278856 RepID=A0A212FLD0_DANPL|nr:hypothetical protein KGM_206410 [Danaus plexippus plexippus]